MIFVIAPSYQWWATYCVTDADPKINPRDLNYLVLHGPTDDQKLHGIRKQPGDSILWLGPVEWNFTGVVQQLYRMGFEINAELWDLIDDPFSGEYDDPPF